MNTTPRKSPASFSIPRREFLHTGAAAIGLACLPTNVLGAPRRVGPNEKLNLAFIGVGGRGVDNLQELSKLNDIKYDADETKCAVRLQESITGKVPPLDDVGRVYDTAGKLTMGSTDVGDVSWQVPTSGFTTACWVPGTPAHSWQAVACGGTTIGKKGMLLAAKNLAATAWDLFADPQFVADAKAEFKRRLDGRTYKPLLDKDLPPPLDYRLPPKRRVAAE